MKKILRFLDDNLEKTLCALMLGYVAVSLNVEIFARYILNSPTAFTDEIARIFMICIVFLGTSLAVKTRSHVVIDVLPKLSPKASVAVNITADSIFIIFCFIFIASSFRAVSFHKMLKTSTDGLGLPYWILLSVMPLSFMLTILRLGQSIALSWKNRLGGHQ